MDEARAELFDRDAPRAVTAARSLVVRKSESAGAPGSISILEPAAERGANRYRKRARAISCPRAYTAAPETA